MFFKANFCIILCFLIYGCYCESLFYYKEQMRNFIIEISKYARAIKPGFILIPQNGNEIITKTGDLSDPVQTDFLKYIDGWGREDLYYGADSDNVHTKTADTNYLISYLDIAKKYSIKNLVTDYCWTRTFIDDSYKKNLKKGYISFVADRRDLSNIPIYPNKPINENSNIVTKLSQAKNFLYLINPGNYATKANFIKELKKTNYDVIIMDVYFNDKNFTKAEIDSLKIKANRGKRLIISYISIGEAESYRSYWKSDWRVGNPSFVDAENPNWKGNYKVKYWDKEWQKIIYGNNNSYVKYIINSGFDGIYMDIIDAFYYFESKN